MLTTAANGTNDETQSFYVARIDELKREQSEAVSANRESNPPQFTAFFIMLFVFGQVMSQWALLSGHVAAWVAGLLFSLVGISVALFSLYARLNERNERDHSRRDQLLRHNGSTTDETDELRQASLAAHLDFSPADQSKVSA